MRGASAIQDYRAHSRRNPDAIFIIEGKNSCDTTSSLKASNYWFPEIVLSKADPVAGMDFSCLDGEVVHAVLGENYKRSFRICEAIVQAKPLHLIANIAGGHPLLEWNCVKGFFENE